MTWGKRSSIVFLMVAFASLLERSASMRDVPELPQAAATKPAAPEKWTMTITTSGGFIGHGIGGIVAMFDARTGTARLTRPCRRQLTSADLEPLARAVAEAKPAAWAHSYVRPANPTLLRSVLLHDDARAGAGRRDAREVHHVLVFGDVEGPARQRASTVRRGLGDEEGSDAGCKAR